MSWWSVSDCENLYILEIFKQNDQVKEYYNAIYSTQYSTTFFDHSGVKYYNGFTEFGSYLFMGVDGKMYIKNCGQIEHISTNIEHPNINIFHRSMEEEEPAQEQIDPNISRYYNNTAIQITEKQPSTE